MTTAKKISIGVMLQIAILIAGFAFSGFPVLAQAHGVYGHGNGQLTVCKMIIDQNGNIATSSAGLPLGYFGLTVGTSTDIFGNPLFQDQFATGTFVPNTDLTLSNQNDAQCVTHTEPLGTYYYSQEDIAGNFSAWTQFPVRYFGGDQSAFTVAGSSQYDTATLSNDAVTLTDSDPNQTIVMVNGYQAATVTPPTGPAPITIVASKIVCDSQSDLPHYGLGGPDITSTTATDYVAAHPDCHLLPNWNFQWASSTATDPGGSFTGPASGWNTFGPTDSNGVATTTVAISANDPYLWMREVLEPGYLTFSYPANLNNDPNSAEMYCHSDVLNYDNYDRVDGPFGNGGDTYYCVAWNVLTATTTPPTNTAPTITLLGANPLTLTVGDTFVDPGATAHDKEDGDLTSKIIVTGGPVDTSVVGTTTLTYSVTDSGGLTATTTRTVVVNPANNNGGGGGCTSNCGGGNPPPPATGTISVCLVLADTNGTIATTSNGLPAGTFAMNLATTSDLNGIVDTTNFVTNSFAPNRMLITSGNDGQCQTFNNLPFGTYYYSQLASSTPTDAAWQTPKYNDQFDTPVSSLMTFFAYSSTSPDADGQVVLNSMDTNQTIVVLDQYNPATTTTPTTDADLSIVKTVNNSNPNEGDTIDYTLTVSALGPATSTGVTASDILPAGLTFESATSSVGSYATTTGLWTIGDLSANATATLDISALVNTGTAGTTIVNTASTTETASSTDTNLNNNTGSVSVTVQTPASTGGGCTTNCGGGGGSGCTSNCGGGGGGNGPIVGSIPPATNGGGGNGPIVTPTNPVTTTTTSNGGSCYYLYDYLHTGWNNDPVEVKKLQVFLKDLEGYNVAVTGIYDDQTVTALDAFQVKYASDILIPWDGTSNPSGFTYILTKKKVNEIYCNEIFPLTAEQQQTITNYREFINDLGANGIQVTAPTPAQQQEINVEPTSTSSASTANGIGLGNGSSVSNILATGAPIGSQALKNAAAAILGFPWNWMKGIFDPNVCVFNNPFYCKLIDWILIILVIILIIFGIRSATKKNPPQDPKDIQDVNDELDLGDGDDLNLQ